MEKQKGKLRDFMEAGREELVERISESEVVPQMAKSALEYVTTEGVADVMGNIIGGALPRINGIRLSYQQNRFERNVNAAISEFSTRLDRMDEKLSQMDDSLIEKFRGLYVEWLLDSFQNEKQSDKIPLFVDGYINMMDNSTNDDLMLMFFSTLNDLTDLDMLVLEMYHYNGQVNLMTLTEERKIPYEQIELIKEKLLRNGLLSSKNDEQRDANLDEVVRFVTDLEKQLNAKTGKKLKKAKIKKVSRSESYGITPLGRRYLELTGKVQGY